MYNGMEFITGRNWNYKPHQGELSTEES